MSLGLDGKGALVVGAAGGIGEATARRLSSLGATLALADLDAPIGLADALRDGGGAAHPLACDAASRESVERTVAAAASAMGGVDILVYVAAVCPWDDWHEIGWDDTFDRVLAVNLRGAVLAARAVMPPMQARHWGRIVLVGSLAGRTGGLVASAHYAASKGGLHTLVRWLAQRGAPHGVIVNGVAPASTATPMMEGQTVDLSRIPLGRMSRPDEIAWPIAFLSSEAASYVCGTVLDVNGGVHMG